jgi:hypothetical protein
VALQPVGGPGCALIAPMSERKRYPSDLSDERWALIEPVITAWKAVHPSVSRHQRDPLPVPDRLPVGVPAA